MMDINMIATLSLSVMCGVYWIYLGVAKPPLRKKKEVVEESRLVSIEMSDGSVAVIDPRDPIQVAAIREVHEESQQPKQVDAFYSPMPGKDISEYDFDQVDYEVKTAGQVREDLYD